MNFQNASFEYAAGRVEQLPACTLPEVVFSGRSNVGKSSLINKILNRKALARVSSTPGKTGTINFYALPECRLVDLPGYGYAKVSDKEKLRWAGLVEGYLSAGRRIACVLQLVDMRRLPTEDDAHMIRYLLESGLPFAVVGTKSDKLNKTQRASQEAAFREYFQEVPGGVLFLPFSALNGEGAGEVRAYIEESCAGAAER